MKKIVIPAFLILIACSVPISAGSSAQFKGMVISLTEDSMELKRSSREITLYFTADSAVIFRNEKVSRESLDLCQIVRAYYRMSQGRREIIRLEILTPGYCKQ